MAFPTSLTGRLLLPLLTFHVADSLFLLAGTGYILGHMTDVGPGSCLGLFIMASGLLGAGTTVLLVRLAGYQHGAENSRLTETARQMANGHFCLTISAALLDKQGRSIGIFGADLDFEGLSRMQEGV
ncbi:MAG TPA: PDC sensor domain-containing protein [Deltaproteobacteria bacterium]|nr:PDC sensor domain-containing protein [Deltaproteobacteria bacterium]HQB39316.1 PDC sensor domain-containing protein [Deltaproteobacteria bacterium]